MDELTKLAIKYGTDKWGKHHYTPVYYKMFKDRRNEVKKVLEIGSAEGAGLFMFRDFFPKATIYGLEIDIERVRLFKNEERIVVWQGDQSNKQDLDTLLNVIGTDLDLVIDDGSHKLEDQVFSFLTIMPHLKKGATYVIEDVADVNIVTTIVNTDQPNLFFAGKLETVGKRYDDRMFVAIKR